MFILNIMKMVIFILLLPVLVLTGREGSHSEQSDITFTTFNIHYITPKQTSMRWEDRRAAVLKVLNETESDIIAFQEMETFEGGHVNSKNLQLDYLLEHMPDYLAAAVGDAGQYPVTQPVFYKKERFEPLDQGFFFFSSTPDVIYSPTFNGSYPAFCVWVQFRDLHNGKTFHVFNMHNDYKNRRNRILSSRLILSRLSDISPSGGAVIIAGDFNALSWFRPVSVFRDAGFEIGDIKGSTFHFNRGWNLFPAIDHVLYNRHFQFAGSQVFKSQFRGVYPSDHYPVSAFLNWNN